MGLAVKLSLLVLGFFCFFVYMSRMVKHYYGVSSSKYSTPICIDIARRSSFLYSFAALVMAKLLEYNPYSLIVQAIATVVPLAFFTLTVIGYFITGLKNKTNNLFRERTFTLTWFMCLLIPGEIAGVLVILWGFISTQILSN